MKEVITIPRRRRRGSRVIRFDYEARKTNTMMAALIVMKRRTFIMIAALNTEAKLEN